MSEAHKRPYRHPKYKTSYHVKNWPEYEKSMRDRRDITVWLSQDAIDTWMPLKTGGLGDSRSMGMRNLYLHPESCNKAHSGVVLLRRE